MTLLRVELIAASTREQYNPISAFSWSKGILVSTAVIDNKVHGVVLTNNDEFDVVPLNLLGGDYDSAKI